MNDQTIAEITRLQDRTLVERDTRKLDLIEDALNRLVGYLERDFADARVARIRAERHAGEHLARRSEVIPIVPLPEIETGITQRELTHPVMPRDWPPPRFDAHVYDEMIFQDQISRLAVPPRDRLVLSLIAQGESTAAIGEELAVTPAAASMAKTRALRRAKPYFQAA